MYLQSLSQSRNLLREVACFFLLLPTPAFLHFYWIAYSVFDASLVSAAQALSQEGPRHFFLTHLPDWNIDTAYIYADWLLFQAFLFVTLPGPSAVAPRTPGGRALVYTLNGLSAWFITVLLSCVGSYFGIINLAYIAENWDSFLVTASGWCLLLVFTFQVKARLYPDDVGDTLITG